MTNKAQEAYTKGFCKTAEAYKVDPKHLVNFYMLKQASKIPVPFKRLVMHTGKRLGTELTPQERELLTSYLTRASRGFKRSVPGANDAVANFLRTYLPSVSKGGLTPEIIARQMAVMSLAEQQPKVLKALRQRQIMSWLKGTLDSGVVSGYSGGFISGAGTHARKLTPRGITRRINAATRKNLQEMESLSAGKKRRLVSDYEKYFSGNGVTPYSSPEEIAAAASRKFF